MEEDPRLNVMRSEWFQGKDCLDIGCNSGNITISIGKINSYIAHCFLFLPFNLKFLIIAKNI